MHQVRKACQLCRSIIGVRKVLHALSKRLCCRDTCVIRVGIKLRWGMNVNSFRWGSPFVCLQGAQRRQSKEFHLPLHLQRWLWSSGMSQEHWQAGQCVNLPFNRPSTACQWPNSQSWQRKRRKKKRRENTVKLKASYRDALAAGSHFLLISRENHSYYWRQGIHFVRHLLS